MSTDVPASNEAPEAWPALTLVERRVLGVMVEKAKTTPDAYPMSVNALVTGANQKSNRDPVMTLTDEEAEETLAGMQGRGLVSKITGGRVVRWRHNLYDHWHVDKVELAILAELLLRGPQTEGELRGRASRMEPLDDLEQLRQALRPLAERRLVVFLGPEGRRGTLITHGFHAPRELDAARSQVRVEEPSAPAAAGVGRGAGGEQNAELQDELRRTRDELALLDTRVQQTEEALKLVRQELQNLKESLGA